MERFDIMRMDAGWQTPAQTLALGIAAGSLLPFVMAYLIAQSLLVSICAGDRCSSVFQSLSSRRSPSGRHFLNSNWSTHGTGRPVAAQSASRWLDHSA